MQCLGLVLQRRPVAVVEATFGSGTVMAFSLHFESTNGLEKVIVNAIQVVRKK